MNFVEAYLLRQRRRFVSFLSLEAAFVVLSVGFLFASLREITRQSAEVWDFGFLRQGDFLIAILGVIVSIVVVRRLRADFSSLTLSAVADRVEKESKLTDVHRGELRSLAFFLEDSSAVSHHVFFRAHEKYLQRFRKLWVSSITPRFLFYFRLSICIAAFLSFSVLRHFEKHLPDASLAFSLDQLEVLSPASTSPWNKVKGSLAVIEGSRLRYHIQNQGHLRLQLFERRGDRLVAQSCTDYCEWSPETTSQVSIGSWLSRTPFVPVRVLPDERPRSFLMAEVKGDYLPDLRLRVRSLKSLRFRASASDDLEIKTIEFVERIVSAVSADGSENKGGPQERILKKWDHTRTLIDKSSPPSIATEFSETLFRSEWLEEFVERKSGEFHYFLRIFDRKGSSESLPIIVVFIDDEELRKERSLALRAMIDSWVHVLGGLIDIQGGSSQEERLLKNLKSMNFTLPAETSEKAPLVSAYYAELQRLALRIENEVSNPTRLETLIQRVERQILYGLSLLFQEKVGGLRESQENLSATQADLQTLLDKLKKGELPKDANQLKDAFKAVAEKIEDLQKKIRELPSGPTDDLVNREALQNQLEESESLESKIAEIQKQMESGQSAAALKELESLLNQLSLLTKEMDRSLSQWKENLDQGSQASIQNYQKALEDLKTRQQKLSEQSEQLKSKIDFQKKEANDRWQAPDPKKEEKLAEEAKKLSDQQEGLQKDFQKARESLENQLGQSEWRDLFRSEDIQSLEEKAQTMMQSSKEGLKKRLMRDSIADQRTVIDSLRKIQEATQNKQKQIRAQAEMQGQQMKERTKTKVEVLSNESQGDRERRRKILDSLQQSVEDRYQKSHERYFEELLQR